MWVHVCVPQVSNVECLLLISQFHFSHQVLALDFVPLKEPMRMCGMCW